MMGVFLPKWVFCFPLPLSPSLRLLAALLTYSHVLSLSLTPSSIYVAFFCASSCCHQQRHSPTTTSTHPLLCDGRTLCPAPSLPSTMLLVGLFS